MVVFRVIGVYLKVFIDFFKIIFNGFGGIFIVSDSFYGFSKYFKVLVVLLRWSFEDPILISILEVGRYLDLFDSF